MNVKKYRKAKGYTQNQVADKLNMKQNTYSDKERGRSNFTVKELLALEVLFDASISEMFKDVKDKVDKELKANTKK